MLAAEQLGGDIVSEFSPDGKALSIHGAYGSSSDPRCGDHGKQPLPSYHQVPQGHCSWEVDPGCEV